jgi:hypothetical protein
MTTGRINQISTSYLQPLRPPPRKVDSSWPPIIDKIGFNTGNKTWLPQSTPRKECLPRSPRFLNVYFKASLPHTHDMRAVDHQRTTVYFVYNLASARNPLSNRTARKVSGVFQSEPLLSQAGRRASFTTNHPQYLLFFCYV